MYDWVFKSIEDNDTPGSLQIFFPLELAYGVSMSAWDIEPKMVKKFIFVKLFLKKWGCWEFYKFSCYNYKGEFFNSRTKILVFCPGILSTYFSSVNFCIWPFSAFFDQDVKWWNSITYNKQSNTRSSLTKCVINHWYRIILSAPSLHTNSFLLNI